MTAIFLRIEITTTKKYNERGYQSTRAFLPSGLRFGFEFIFKAVLFEDSHGRYGRKKWERSWTRKKRG